MASQAPAAHGLPDSAAALVALVRAEGSAGHRHSTADVLARGPEAARNMADVVHHLGLLHGRHPGVVDHAAARHATPPLGAFLSDAARGFTAERGLLTRLVVAVGPLPSTPGQADADSAVLAQHHAIDMLATSDRDGCALGAAIALMIDWEAVRPVLDAAAHRLGIEAAPSVLPDSEGVRAALRAAALPAPAARAMLFGAQQIVAQHRGLWDLLEARALARSDY